MGSMCNMFRTSSFLLFAVLFTWVSSSTVTATVSYDDKAIVINGYRRLLISGSIHYPRSTPEMWPDLIQKAKDGGLDVIQTYVFWNGHEPSPGKYYFEGRYDLVRFIKLVQQAGLYVHLRIGPYVCAEWNFGGFPVWLKYVPGIEFRTDNGPFKAAMQAFTTKIVDMMKSEKLFEPQGGPIIMSQIENEYGPIEWEIGAPGKAYTKWAAQMAVNQDTGVPWIMCKHETAPDPMIDTCNGFYCEGFTPNKPYKPKMFTELWTGWYTKFGGTVPNRPAEDLAYAVARFVQNNGTFFNYYMYHGGTNFGRTASGLFVATSYDYDAPIDEYGLLREPKWGHLRDLHKAIKLCEPALVFSNPTVTWPGKNLEIHVFKYKAGGCAAFLSNFDPQYSAKITFQNTQYDLPPWSISILPDCKNVVFNTARVTSQTSEIKMIPVGAFPWQSYNEQTPTSDDSDTLAMEGLYEQLNITRDASDYLWYLTDVNIAPDEGFLRNGQSPLLTVMSAGHTLQVFINGQLSGTVYGGLENTKLTYHENVKLKAGINKISLLSSAVGLPNVGLHFERYNTGVLGPVSLSGLNEGTRDLTKQKWSYKVGLKGESLSLHTLDGSSSVEWLEGSLVARKQPLTWYKANFNAPTGNEPLALDMSSMGKGQIWINGEGIGRHWPGYIARGDCSACHYSGIFKETKCQSGCGEPSQRCFFLFTVLFICVSSATVTATVSYDDKAIVINGNRRLLISGSIHYPRSTPEMWPDLIQKAKDGGLDVIQTYVFWNGHEPSPGKYYFEGRYDLVRFIKLVQQAGLYVHLRIGPYICAEWNFGGFPVWLKYVPGIEFRTDNGPFKAAMEAFTTKIVDMMKSEKLFEPQGGPIIMSQIENEYGPIEWEIGAPGKAYTKWAAQMAVNQDTGVPWIMCRHGTAPDPVIDTCNGFYCEGFTPNKPYKPKMFTELWTGWYTNFGGTVPNRPAEDLAYAVARFVQNNGTFFNYYMYHGGTNFGRTASGLFVATSYDYDAPLDEYGLLREPKWGHLRDLHKAIKLCEPALVFSNPIVTSPGKNLEIHVFKYKAGGCAAFLSNFDPLYSAKITFQNTQYDLPPWSISILPDCKNEVFNTARVTSQTSKIKMIPVGSFPWQSYNEQTPTSDDSDTVAMEGLYEQLNITRDASDYLWYLTDVIIAPDEGFLRNGQSPLLTVMSAGHTLQVFINGQLSGTVYGGLENPKLTYHENVKLKAGINKISLLSSAVGLPNGGLHFERYNTGVLGPVSLSGLNEGTRDLTKQKWSYKVGFKGESLNLHTLDGSSSVEWLEGSLVAQKQPLTWYKATFNAPTGNEPLALDMSSMGKGQIWINGEGIGRHWPGYIAHGDCGACHYSGIFKETKCQSGCGEPSQRWYHVPRSWLKPTGNFLVVFEEWGGNPAGISLVKRTAERGTGRTLKGHK
ncbi:hypothetical protein RJ639_018797 [Escallonia herrerae]|uniref:Beta-galactosidase n=1 Tax=Escallonia herrerae TaxID=1293975 RepID=A0AA88V6L1_9ASTE|nr:hypothetical protein RJ639_018797 [Escallonia herrerae]